LLLGKPDRLVCNLVLAEKIVFEGSKGALFNGGVYFMHQPGNEPQIVYGG
jgi:hypothetical protein